MLTFINISNKSLEGKALPIRSDKSAYEQPIFLKVIILIEKNI